MALLERNLHLGEAARCRRVYCRNDLGNAGLDKCPASLSEHDDRNLAACKVLLIAEILVRRHQHFKACGFGLVQEVAIVQFFPPSGAGFRHRVVVDQIAGECARGAVVEKNQHLWARSRCFCAVRREL
jgi:hypothetical protein